MRDLDRGDRVEAQGFVCFHAEVPGKDCIGLVDDDRIEQPDILDRFYEFLQLARRVPACMSRIRDQHRDHHMDDRRLRRVG